MYWLARLMAPALGSLLIVGATLDIHAARFRTRSGRPLPPPTENDEWLDERLLTPRGFELNTGAACSVRSVLS